MMDQQNRAKLRQSNRNQADGIPEALEGIIRQLQLAMRRASLYPAEHPVRVKSAGEICESLRRVLSSQESHSLTAIEDKLYIDQHRMGGNGQGYIASDRMSVDLARKLRRRGIRSVVFSQGIELRELEKFLDIMTMEAKAVIAQNGAGVLLRAADDISHIKIVDIEYENIQVMADDGDESSMDLVEVLVPYLRGEAESLSSESYAYLISLLDNPDMMARLIEKSIDYDGINEPDSDIVNQCMNNLIGLGEESTDDEQRNARDFQKKLMEATLQLENPVKNIVFSTSDDNSVPTRLMDGLSTDDIARFITGQVLECGTDEPTIPLRRISYELLNVGSPTARNSEMGGSSSSLAPSPPRPLAPLPPRSLAPVSPDEQLAEVKNAIQRNLVEKEQEGLFNNVVVPLFEEVSTELEIDKLDSDQIQLEHLLDELYSPEQKQDTEDSETEIVKFFTTEDDFANSTAIMLEVLESETDPENYSDIADLLEVKVENLVMESQDLAGLRDQYLAMALHIIDVLFEQANRKSQKPLELQTRAQKFIANVSTDEFVDQTLFCALRAELLDWDALETFIQQMGEKAIPPLMKNFLDAGDLPERHKLRNMLISMGPIIIPELRKWLVQDQWVMVTRDVMPMFIEIGGTEALDCFSDALNHSNLQVRRAAVNALATSDIPGAAELILNKIQDDNEDASIIQSAISALGRIGNKQVIEEIESILKGENDVLKREAIYALGNIGGEESISILSDLLKQRRLIFRRRRLEALQLRAVEALSRIGTQSAIEVLQEISKIKKGNVKSACDEALKAQ